MVVFLLVVVVLAAEVLLTTTVAHIQQVGRVILQSPPPLKVIMAVMPLVSKTHVVVNLGRKVAEVVVQVRRVLMLPVLMVMGVTVAQAPLLQFLVHQ
jgi:hypothetical protein